METTPFRTDIFQYDLTFRAYKETVDESENGWPINHTFLKLLQDQGLFNRSHPLYLIGDIACGDGSAIINCLKDIDFKAGIEIRTMDKNPDFIGNCFSTDNNKCPNYIPAVEKNFAKAKQSQVIPLKSYRLLYGDVTKSNITQVMCNQHKVEQSTNLFDLVYVNYAIHYAYTQHQNGRLAITYVIDSIVTDLLSNSGILIIHNTCLKPDSYMSIADYIRGITQDLIPSEEDYQRYSGDALVERSCNELGLTYFEIPYTMNLYFSKDLKKYANVYKDPSRYHELLDNHEALQDLYRIIFISHRAPDDLYADKSPRGLNTLVDNVIYLVEKYGSVRLICCMQIILGRQASDELKHKVQIAVQVCQQKLTPLK